VSFGTAFSTNGSFYHRVYGNREAELLAIAAAHARYVATHNGGYGASRYSIELLSAWANPNTVHPIKGFFYVARH
jgi:hypothetical protein